MPKSFLVKKTRHVDMAKREGDNTQLETPTSGRISPKDTIPDWSAGNKDEAATEVKSRDVIDYCNSQSSIDEGALELNSSICTKTPFSSVFSQSTNKIISTKEQDLKSLSTLNGNPWRQENSTTERLGDLLAKKTSGLHAMVKQEIFDNDEVNRTPQVNENVWRGQLMKELSMDMAPSLLHHSSIASQRCSSQHLPSTTDQEDFEISEFVQLCDDGLVKDNEKAFQDFSRSSSPSSRTSEESFSSFTLSGQSTISQPTTDAKTKHFSSKTYRYTCDVCDKSFSRSNTLKTHKRIHTGDKPFTCEQCGRAFRQPGNLTRHRLTHTSVKPYVCSQCNKAFNRASNLHTHMRTHTNYKPFVCDFCGKGFHQKIDMKIHRYTHTGEKPHKCDKCGRGFKQLTHLTYHLRTHSDLRMYRCEHCGKGFNQKGNLQAHIYGHTGERPFKCQTCGKGFTLASTLNTHKRTHALKKPFECQFCNKAFYQRNALKTHVIASHPFANGVSLL